MHDLTTSMMPSSSIFNWRRLPSLHPHRTSELQDALMERMGVMHLLVDASQWGLQSIGQCSMDDQDDFENGHPQDWMASRRHWFNRHTSICFCASAYLLMWGVMMTPPDAIQRAALNLWYLMFSLNWDGFQMPKPDTLQMGRGSSTRFVMPNSCWRRHQPSPSMSMMVVQSSSAGVSSQRWPPVSGKTDTWCRSKALMPLIWNWCQTSGQKMRRCDRLRWAVVNRPSYNIQDVMCAAPAWCLKRLRCTILMLPSSVLILRTMLAALIFAPSGGLISTNGDAMNSSCGRCTKK